MTRLSSELVLSLTDRVSGPAAGVGRSLDRLKRDQRGLAQATTMTANSTREMGRARSMMLAGASRALAPIAGAFSAAEVVSTAADFETALTNIQKKSGASAEQTAKLGEEIKALATSGDLAVPIEEIASAYERGAAAGIPLDELRDFAALSAKAADAFEMSAADVGNASAGFSSVLNVPRAEMERYFDLINGLADAGIADESGIVDYIDQAGAMAKTFGFSAQETAALGAALANLKVSAAKGATATNSIFTRLLAPDALSSDGREAYYQLIKDDKKFKKQLANGKADEAFVEVLDSLRAMNKEARTGIIVELFGQDHLDVMTQMVEGAEEVKRNLAYAAGSDWFGSLDKSYKLKLDDFWSQWQILKNDLATAPIDIGNAGMPALKAGLEGVRALIAEIRAGMTQMEMEIDWSQVDLAKVAVGSLGQELAAALNIDTSKSSLKDFFSEISALINSISEKVKYVAEEGRAIARFAKDPIGELTREPTKEEIERSGIHIWTPEEKARRVAEHRAANPEYAARDRQAEEMQRHTEVLREKNPPDRRPRLSTPAERGTRPRADKPIPAFAPPVPTEVLPQPRFGATPVPTPRQEPVVEPLGRSTGGPAVPTARPDIEGPVRAEAERAAQAAEAAGRRISDAFSVTVAPRIDPSSIAAADAAAAKLEARLQRIAGQQARIRQDAASLGSGGDDGGLQADIED